MLLRVLCASQSSLLELCLCYSELVLVRSEGGDAKCGVAGVWVSVH